MSRPGGSARARPALTLIVVAVIACAAAVDAAVSKTIPSPTPVQDATAVPVADATSSAAVCAGGTSGPGQPADPIIYLTNTTGRAVLGTEIAVVTQAGGQASIERAVKVPPLGTDALDPTAGLPTGWLAASFRFAGGGVVATQAVRGPDGWSTAPCASEPSDSWDFAGGSTTPGQTLTLAMDDPTASSAVVNVTFLTPSGVIAPPEYQGITLDPGELLTEAVGTYVQDQPDVATFVSTESGSVVADELQQWTGAAVPGLSVRLGATQSTDRWVFAQNTDAPGSTVTFHLANPGGSAAAVTFTFGLGQASVVPERVVVPGQGVATVTVSGRSGIPASTPYSVAVDSTEPIVVSRSIVGTASSVPPGHGAMAGSPTLARRWLEQGPGVAAAPPVAQAAVTSLAIDNPQGFVVRAVVASLTPGGPTLRLTVASRSVVLVAGAALGPFQAEVVTASAPVAVEVDSVPEAVPGVVASTGVVFGS